MVKATSKRKIRRTGGLRSKAWWVLRKNKSMTRQDIQNSICNGSEKAAKSNLCRWLIKLVAIGILDVKKIDDGILTSNGIYLYTLIKDLGPDAPVVRVDGGVFDPNSGQVIQAKQPEKPYHISRGGSSDVAITRL